MFWIWERIFGWICEFSAECSSGKKKTKAHDGSVQDSNCLLIIETLINILNLCGEYEITHMPHNNIVRKQLISCKSGSFQIYKLSMFFKVTNHIVQSHIVYSSTAGVPRLFCPKNQIIWELKIAQYKMYTKILALGSGTTGLDNPGLLRCLPNSHPHFLTANRPIDRHMIRSHMLIF